MDHDTLVEAVRAWCAAGDALKRAWDSDENDWAERLARAQVARGQAEERLRALVGATDE